MKRQLVLVVLGLSLTFTGAWAQITLGPNDLYLPGNYSLLTATGFLDPGPSGENRVWDFSNLKQSKTEGVKIEAFKGGGQGINANLIEWIDGKISDYYLKTGDAIYTVTGNAQGGYQNIRFLQFPCNYGQDLADSALNISRYPGEELGYDSLDTVRAVTHIRILSKTDAWGTLKMKGGIFEVMRIKMQLIFYLYLEGKKIAAPTL